MHCAAYIGPCRPAWGIRSNLGKHYTGFKLGNKVVFSVGWGGAYPWKIRLKLPEGGGDTLKGEYWEFQGYDKILHEATFRPLQPVPPDVRELEALFEEACRRVSGAK